MVATWLTPNPKTPAQQLDALQIVCRILRDYPADGDMFRAVYGHIWAVAYSRQTENQLISREQLMDDLQVTGDHTFPIAGLPAQIVGQKTHMVQMMANLLPPGILADGGDQNVWTQLMDLTNVNVALIPNDNEPIQIPDVNIPNQWRGWIDQQRLSFYDVLAIAQERDIAGWNMSWAMMLVVCVAKGSNITDTYYRRRMDAMVSAYLNLGLDRNITADVMRKFATLYSPQRASVDEVYAMMIATYNILRAYEVGPLTWILEQASASHITAAVQLSQIILKFSNAPYERIKDWIEIEQFRS